MPSPIIKFYAGTGTDDQDRKLDQILGWDFDKLESVHNYIQWLFPLTDRSSANWNAPVLTQADIEIFQSSDVVRKNLLRSFSRMMSFYGFEVNQKGDAAMQKRIDIDSIKPGGNNPVSLQKSADFPQRAANWLTRGNHNFLRLTRIMKSMNLANLNNYSQALFGELEKLYESDYGSVIGFTTFQYWKEAAGKK